MEQSTNEPIRDRLDRICEEFEELWKQGLVPNVADQLEKIETTNHAQLIVELLPLDREYRSKHNLPCDSNFYLNILSDFAKQIETMFPTTKDVEVEEEKTQLPKQEFVENASLESSKITRRIGPYKLLQPIGEGGMGTVWMAEQEKPVRRRVALKLIKTDPVSKDVIARFEAERQALALMDHQNIAKVLDAGTTQHGNPYFVMELVKGIPITQFCDDNKLSIDARLELFIPVCKAIQHAHQKGILHRDLKPSNVLVTLYDGEATPKVIDFGLAKALDHTTKLTDKTMFTEFGKIVGTLQYMSPEQAEMNQLDVDTRTDIYSLGVMLYELLTGSTPLDKETLGKKALLQVLEIIREVEPPRPSNRFSSSGDAITGISHQRKIAPAKLQQILRGELDWVVMKALEKDRRRRYDSASDFADDISRYLDCEPVTARPPSSGYRLQKFIAKNRGLVAGVTVLIVVLLMGIAGTTAGMFWAFDQNEIADLKTIELTKQKNIIDEKEKRLREETDKLAATNIDLKKALDEAEEERRNTRKVVDLVYEVFDQPSKSEDGSPVTGLDLFKRVESRIVKGFGDYPEIQARLLNVIARSYESLGFPNSELMQNVYSLYSKTEGEKSLAALRAKVGLADTVRAEGDIEKSLKLIREAVDDLTNEYGIEQNDTLWARNSLGYALRAAGKHEEALEIELQTLNHRIRFSGGDAPETANTRISIGHCLNALGREKEANQEFKVAVNAIVESLGESDPATLRALENLAHSHMILAEFDKSIAGFRRALAFRKQQGENSQDTFFTTRGLVRALLARAKPVDFEEAVKQMEDCIQGIELHWNGLNRKNYGFYRLLSDVYLAVNKPSDAVTVCKRLFDFDLNHSNNEAARLLRKKIKRIKEWNPSESSICKGLEFDGKKDILVVPSIFFDGQPPITWESTFSLREFPGPEGFSNIIGSCGSSGAALEIGGKQLEFDIKTKRAHRSNFKDPLTGYSVTKTPIQIELNRKYHAAVVWDGNFVKLFVDGKLAAENSGINSCSRLTPFPICIGGDPGDGFSQFHFCGIFYSARITNDALYFKDFNPPNKLDAKDETVLLFDLTRNSGEFAEDLSGNSNHGVILGATWLH